MDDAERQSLLVDTPDAEQRLLALHINEIQLLLAEKRTALAVLRTGIAIMALPISVLSLLIQSALEGLFPQQ